VGSTLTVEQLETARGRNVYSADGDKIGKVEEVFLDGQTHRPEWLGIGTGFFGMKRVLVPIEGASLRDGGVLVPHPTDRVKDTPDIDGDYIDPETERALYAHYGLSHAEAQAPGAADSAVVTRSEEELRVGKREVEAGRLRVHKWVETEQVEVPVEIRREKARVVREPVDPSAGGEIGGEELEVTLREEQPVVAKETVAKERIRIEKDVEATTETVTGEVRKEQVDVDGEERS
jgi:uncharacterized protein (TIGR02271 family)